MQTEKPKVEPAWEKNIPIEKEENFQVEVDTIGTTAPDDAYKVRTRYSFATHPVSKGVVVLIFSFCAVSVLGIFMKLMSGGFSSGTAKVTPKQTPTQKKQGEISEADTLKFKLWQAKQDNEIEGFKRKQQVQKIQSTSPPATKPTTVQRYRYVSVPAPTPTYPTHPNYLTQIPTRPATPLTPITTPKKLQQQKLQQPPQDPMEEWRAASYTGISGQVFSRNDPTQALASSSSSDSNSDRPPDNERAIANNSDFLPSGGVGTAPTQMVSQDNAQSQQQIAQQSFGTSRSTLPQVQPGDYVNSTNNLIVGTVAAAKLQTPVAWTGEMQNPNRNFLVQLTEPLKGSDSSVVVPKNAYIVARVTNATRTGIIQLKAVSFLVTRNDRTIERSIPEEAILILGKDGGYLQAKVTRKRNTSNDVGTVVLSGISRVASLSNQPRYQSSYSDGGFIATSSSHDPNYVAGFTQGATDQILRQEQQRNQQAQQIRNFQPNVLTVKRGTPLQIYVNQSISLE